MISIDKQRVNNLIDHFQDEIKKQHSAAFAKLLKMYKENKRGLKSSERQFLTSIIHSFKSNNLVSIDRQSIEDCIARIGKCPSRRKIKFAGKTKKGYLKDEIIQALGYTNKRDYFYPKYFEKLGIKSCVYCNSQLTLSISKQRLRNRNTIEKHVARFQVDHYYPKDKYPYLSIALFNLYPTCASCNNIKSNNSVDFELYADSVVKSPYLFELDKLSLVQFLISRNDSNLKVIFRNIENPRNNDIFCIQEIYDTQKDVAAEIVLKSIIYNDAYRRHLKSYRINSSQIDRLILGNYTGEHEIHKRPLSKFMQDIGRDLGLI